MEEENEKENTEALSKEDILERSRKENQKNGDEREQARWQFVSVCGYAGALLAAIVLMILFYAKDFDGIVIQGINLIFATAGGAMLCCTAIVAKRNKKLFLTLAIVEILACIMLWVFFALELAGINI